MKRNNIQERPKNGRPAPSQPARKKIYRDENGNVVAVGEVSPETARIIKAAGIKYRKALLNLAKR